jgi:hypothetical protein
MLVIKRPAVCVANYNWLDDILIVEQDCSSDTMELKSAIVEATLTFRIFLLCLSKAFANVR